MATLQDACFYLPDYAGAHGLYRLAAFASFLVFTFLVVRRLTGAKAFGAAVGLFLINVVLVGLTMDTNEFRTACDTRTLGQIILIFMILSPLLSLLISTRAQK